MRGQSIEKRREGMNEDRELELWREQWGSVAEPPPEFQRKVQQRIKRQDRRFVLGNLLTVIAFLGILIFALFVRHSCWETSADRLPPDWSR